MNVCIYGASSNDIDKRYIEATEELGRKLADKGHTLVFGAGASGLMGAAARGFTAGKGKIIGVAPSFFNVDGVLYDKCKELIFTETMRERKKEMEEHSEAFVMLPGGIGTYEEFFEILTLKQLGRHGKAIIVYNILDYFEPMIKMLDECVSKGFMNEKTNEIYEIMNNADDIVEYIDNYKPEVGRVFKF